jgi:RNA polymerase sigma-70 factor (ECF subfamily)
MTAPGPDTEELLRRCVAGEQGAREQLLTRHQERLRQMIAVRLDRRLLARLDASDIVQEVLLEAHQKLDDYMRDRPLPFYPWLRQIAWQRLVKLHEHHRARKRGVQHEEARLPMLPDESALELVRRLAGPGSTPSEQAVRQEVRERVRGALGQMREQDREVLVLRYLEQLSPGAIAEILGVSEGAVKTRHTRALLRLQQLLAEEEGER